MISLHWEHKGLGRTMLKLMYTKYFWLVGFLYFAIGTGICSADTLYLKNGKIIQSDNIWLEDGYFMNTMYGATVGISEDKVDRVQYDSEIEETDSSFQFDVWPFGCTVHQAINIAERNDIPLHKEGIITINKRFHPMVRKYSDASHFYYKTSLLGHFTKVELLFTPSSKQLHTIKITWSIPNARKSMLAKKVESMIVDKYGNTRKSGRQLFYDRTKWITADSNQIDMDIHATSISLSYLHTEFIKQGQYEAHSLKAQKVQAGATKDKNKF